MKVVLIPEENFDKDSKKSINFLMKIAEKKLKVLNISCPKRVEFYDTLKEFIDRIVLDVISYGLTKNQSIEFIKASLNSGTYGTFSIEDNSIIEMNFNPHFKLFYPSIHFLNLLVHESLHLFLYSKFEENIYKFKFKFENGKYVGEERIIQLDEGFAEFLTDKILENFNFDSIKNFPIYSGLNEPPNYQKEVDGLNIDKFNKQFDVIYKKNSEKGYNLIKKRFNHIKGNNLKEKIDGLVKDVVEEIEKLLKHK